nr:molybdopterin molybdotransferase MoeA [uncultured Sphingomonas sp.]
MINFDEAVAIIATLPDRTAVEEALLDRAAGLTLAAPVVATLDSPRVDVSAMDGYAVRDADLAQLPARLPVAAEAFAGTAQTVGQAGQCARIFTGGAVPSGFDRVVVQEIVERDGDFATFAEAPGTARHIRKLGSDFRASDELLPAGSWLTPRAMVAAAAADLPTLPVHMRPRILILGTGDELAVPGTARDRPAAIPQSLSFGVAAMAEQWGGDWIGSAMLPDDRAELERAAGDALDRADLVVVTGGASVGEKDYAKAMFEPYGLDLLFAKVAIKPGKPVWLGRAQGKLVIGLPGNPTSAMVTARLFLAPIIRQMSGGNARSALDWREVALNAPMPSIGDRETFARARWTGSSVSPLSNQDSGAQKALVEAELLVRRPANSPALESGETVHALTF